ncbi:MAG: hypothetical protein ABI723_07810, partial [Bacteroidia bacterium]
MENKNQNKNFIGFIKEYWSFFLFSLAMITGLIGIVGYKISPFHEFTEIKYRQEQQDKRSASTKRHLELGNKFLNNSLTLRKNKNIPLLNANHER